MKTLVEIRDEYLKKLTDNTFGTNEQIPSGFSELDKLTGGYCKGELIVLGARPAMGKTAFAVTQSIQLLQHGIPVLYYSMNLTELQLLYRFLAQIGNKTMNQYPEFISNHKIFKDVTEKQLEKLKSFQLQIDNNYSKGLKSFEKAVEEFKAKYKNRGFIILDYLQLLYDRSYNRENEISNTMLKLKAIAKETGFPILILSQLNRAVETRGGDRQPQLCDLRDSGSIEQEADKILFLHRPEYYGFSSDEDGKSTNGLAKIIIAKNNMGNTENILLHFEHKTATFSEAIKLNNKNFRDMRSDEFEDDPPF